MLLVASILIFFKIFPYGKHLTWANYPLDPGIGPDTASNATALTSAVHQSEAADGGAMAAAICSSDGSVSE